MRTQACLLCLAVSLLCASGVRAQGFMVRPMSVDISAKPGGVCQVPLSFANMRPDASVSISAKVDGLAQSDTGGRALVSELRDVSGWCTDRSCADWLTVERETIAIGPGQTETAVLTVRVPRTARGYHSGAVTAMLKPPAGPEREGLSVGLQVRFLIPVNVRVQGSLREAIEVEDVALGDSPKGKSGNVGTQAVVRVTNRGDTCPALGADVSVETGNGDRWRALLSTRSADFMVYPGNSVSMALQLPVGLPQGTYRVTARVGANGRTAGRKQSTVSYAGLPGARVAGTVLSVVADPEVLDIEVAPGSTKAASLKLLNAGAEPVGVQMRAEPCSSLQGVSRGDVMGTDYAMTTEPRLAPSSFTIGPGQARTVRVAVRADPEWHTASAFAEVVARCTDKAGTPLGLVRTRLRLRNPRVAPETALAIDGPQLACTGEAQHTASILVSNIGTTDGRAEGRLVLRRYTGETLCQAALEMATPALLPLGQTQASGTIDVKGLAPGTYQLHVELTETLSAETFSKVTPVVVGEGGSLELVGAVEAAAPEGQG